MSAIAIAESHLSRARGLAGSRPQLVLVPTGADAARVARADWAARPAVRLTRFGRLVLMLFVSTAVIVGAVGAAGSFASAAGPAQTITVEAGQTMSQIAAEWLPDLSINDGVVAIQLANGLSTPHLHVGEQLVIPAG